MVSISATIRGTRGYVAPKLVFGSTDQVSVKDDVFSFGVLLLDIVKLSGVVDRTNNNSAKYYLMWMYDYLKQDKDILNGEPHGGASNYDERTRKLMMKMAIVALWCIHKIDFNFCKSIIHFSPQLSYMHSTFYINVPIQSSNYPFIKILYLNTILNTLPQDGRKISTKPILTHNLERHAKLRPFVRQYVI